MDKQKGKNGSCFPWWDLQYLAVIFNCKHASGPAGFPTDVPKLKAKPTQYFLSSPACAWYWSGREIADAPRSSLWCLAAYSDDGQKQYSHVYMYTFCSCCYFDIPIKIIPIVLFTWDIIHFNMVFTCAGDFSWNAYNSLTSVYLLFLSKWVPLFLLHAVLHIV